MQVLKAIKIWLEYHKSHSRENTLKSYQMVLANFDQEFGTRNIWEINSDEILSLSKSIVGSSSRAIPFSFCKKNGHFL